MTLAVELVIKKRVAALVELRTDMEQRARRVQPYSLASKVSQAIEVFLVENSGESVCFKSNLSRLTRTSFNSNAGGEIAEPTLDFCELASLLLMKNQHAHKRISELEMRLEELISKQQIVIARYDERQKELQEKLRRVETDL